MTLGLVILTSAALLAKYPNPKWYYEVQTIEATVTAYNSIPGQTDDTPCIGSSGEDICQLRDHGEETCAARFKFGTRINIPGFGICTVRDTPSRRFIERIDIYFGGQSRVNDARKWGKRHLQVTVVY